MKILFNILIVVVKLCASDNSVYDWHVRTIERGSDFDDDFKVQTALNNERQQDLLKISGKTTNVDYYPNSYYSQLNKNIDASSNKAAGVNDKYEFDKNLEQNPFGTKINVKYEDNSNTKNIFGQMKNSASKYDTKKNKISNYKNDEDHSYSKYKDNHQKYHDTKETDHQHHRENLKHLDYYEEDNNSYHDLKHIEYNSYKTDINPFKYKLPDTNSKIIDIENIHNEFKDTKLPNNNHQQSSKENEEKDIPLVSLCSSKYEYIDIESFVGTNLFDSTAKRCFSKEEVALLATRKKFESLIPKNLPQCLLSDQMVAMLLNYFYICHQMILHMTSMGSKHLAQKAFYDTFGGYLNFYMVPVTKYSYYAGQISLNTAQEILNLHQQSKQLLNTNGNGWRAPLQNVLVELKSVYIEPLHIAELNGDTCIQPSFCMDLVMAADENQTDDTDNKLIVQLPKMETEDVNGYLGNIWLPFRSKGYFDLKSESSAYEVVKFYETVTKCYRFKNIDQQYYNNQFKTWFLENINEHLSDEQFYPGLGAVLRIYEYLKRRKKDLNSFGEDLDPTNETNLELTSKNKTIANDPQKPDRLNIKITKGLTDQQTNAITTQEDNKLDFDGHSDFRNSKSLLRTIDLSPTRLVVIAIPVTAIILVLIICCCKCFCKKKKTETPVKTKKNSSSSSSNLLNSPVRFFHTRKKSVTDYSLNEAGNKKNKKSVTIEKMPLLNSDTSALSSPVRNKKFMGKGKTRDSGKSNSKSSWETTYSSK